MSYTMDDFRRDYVKEHLKDLTLEERLKDLTLEERLAGISRAELARFLPIEKVLDRFSDAELEEWLERCKRQPAPRKSKKMK